MSDTIAFVREHPLFAGGSFTLAAVLAGGEAHSNLALRAWPDATAVGAVAGVAVVGLEAWIYNYFPEFVDLFDRVIAIPLATSVGKGIYSITGWDIGGNAETLQKDDSVPFGYKGTHQLDNDAERAAMTKLLGAKDQAARAAAWQELVDAIKAAHPNL